MKWNLITGREGLEGRFPGWQFCLFEAAFSCRQYEEIIDEKEVKLRPYTYISAFSSQNETFALFYS